MDRKSYLRAATLMSVAGVAFSGYLGFVRLSRGLCAFAEPCPFFLGYPACYFGFALFAAALSLALVARVAGRRSAWPAIAIGSVAALGVVFAGGMSVGELQRHAAYRLGLPTCAWGLVFFVGLLALSVAGVRGRPAGDRPRRGEVDGTAASATRG